VEYQKDPCCNYLLRSEQCCLENPKTGKREKISTFDDTLINACCKEGPKVKQTLRRVNQKLYSYYIKLIDIAYSIEGIHKISLVVYNCLGSAISTRCLTNSDCIGKCNSITHSCEVPSRKFSNISTGMTQCVKSKLEPALYDQLVASHFQKVEEGVNVGAKMLEPLKKPLCVNKYNPSQVIDKSGINKVACEAKTKCSDGLDSCSGSGFCGIGCRNVTVDGESKFCDSWNSMSQQNCANKVLCQPFNTYMTKEECEAKTFCNHPANETATAEECANLFICVGYPLLGPKCMINTDVCPPGYTKNAQLNGLCLDSFLNENENQCLQRANASWVSPPTTAKDCLNYKSCIGPTGGLQNKMNHDECVRCGDGGYVLQPSFRPVQAKTFPAFIQGELEWIPEKKLVNVGQYIDEGIFFNHIDFATQINNLFYNLLKSVSKLSYTTQIDYLLTSLKTTACACGTDRSSTSNCFGVPRFPRGGLPCLPGVSDTFKDKQSRVMLKTNPRSCGATQTGDTLTVFEYEIQNVLTSRSLFENKIQISVKKDAKDVCSVMGDGYNVEPAPSGGVTLCVPIETDKFAVVSEKHLIPSIVSSTNLETFSFKTSNVTVDDATFCFSVSDSTTYHAAYCDKVEEKKNDDDDDDDTKNNSSSSQFSFSFALLLFIMMASSFF